MEIFYKAIPKEFSSTLPIAYSGRTFLNEKKLELL